MDRSAPPADTSPATTGYPRRPRWVVVELAIAAVLIIGAAILLLSGGHGPQRHSGGGSTPSHSAPAHADP